MPLNHLPPLHCLQAFEALARLKNGILAAHELSITPSAVSHRIKQLEAIMGTALFADTSYSLSTAGEKCLVVVKNALATLRQLPDAAANSARRTLRVAVTPTFARQLLMPKLPLFRLAYPEIDLVLQVAVPLMASKPQSVDLEIRFGAGDFSDVQSTCLLRDCVTPACSPSYLAESGAFGNFVETSNVQRARLIRSSLEPWKTWFNAFGIPLTEPLDGDQFNDVGMVLEAAAAGYGVVLLRQKLGQAWLDSGRLVRLSDQAVEPPFHHFLCWPEGALGRWECSAFVDWVTTIID